MIDISNLTSQACDLVAMSTGIPIDRVFFGTAPVQMQKPYVRIILMKGNADAHSYGNRVSGNLKLQFDVFDTDLSVVTASMKAISENLSGISLPGIFHSIPRDFGVLSEGDDVENLVYHGWVTIEYIAD